MASAAASPPPSNRSEIGQQERRSADEQSTAKADEAYGPLDIDRHVKDDGRALILYTRRELGDRCREPLDK
jgi:hypothetical protein